MAADAKALAGQAATASKAAASGVDGKSGKGSAATEPPSTPQPAKPPPAPPQPPAPSAPLTVGTSLAAAAPRDADEERRHLALAEEESKRVAEEEEQRRQLLATPIELQPGTELRPSSQLLRGPLLRSRGQALAALAASPDAETEEKTSEEINALTGHLIKALTTALTPPRTAPLASPSSTAPAESLRPVHLKDIGLLYDNSPKVPPLTENGRAVVHFRTIRDNLVSQALRTISMMPPEQLCDTLGISGIPFVFNLPVFLVFLASTSPGTIVHSILETTARLLDENIESYNISITAQLQDFVSPDLQRKSAAHALLVSEPAELRSLISQLNEVDKVTRSALLSRVQPSSFAVPAAESEVVADVMSKLSTLGLLLRSKDVAGVPDLNTFHASLTAALLAAGHRKLATSIDMHSLLVNKGAESVVAVFGDNTSAYGLELQLRLTAALHTQRLALAIGAQRAQRPLLQAGRPRLSEVTVEESEHPFLQLCVTQVKRTTEGSSDRRPPLLCFLCRLLYQSHPALFPLNKAHHQLAACPIVAALREDPSRLALLSDKVKMSPSIISTLNQMGVDTGLGEEELEAALEEADEGGQEVELSAITRGQPIAPKPNLKPKPIITEPHVAKPAVQKSAAPRHLRGGAHVPLGFTAQPHLVHAHLGTNAEADAAVPLLPTANTILLKVLKGLDDIGTIIRDSIDDVTVSEATISALISNYPELATLDITPCAQATVIVGFWLNGLWLDKSVVWDSAAEISVVSQAVVDNLGLRCQPLPRQLVIKSFMGDEGTSYTATTAAIAFCRVSTSQGDNPGFWHPFLILPSAMGRDRVLVGRDFHKKAGGDCPTVRAADGSYLPIISDPQRAKAQSLAAVQ
jgi:hypothetical protein